MNRLTIFAIAATAFAFTASTGPAEAVVYCKTVGVPQGCVVRPTAAAVIYCTAPGVPVGCRARPVARAGTRAAVSVGVNRGGPVNRRGVR